jgi:hypothetical protein
VSNIICRPAAKYTPQMAKAMCQSFRDGHLPNFKISLSEGPVSVDVSSIQEYCDHFFRCWGSRAGRIPDHASCKLPRWLARIASATPSSSERSPEKL